MNHLIDLLVNGFVFAKRPGNQNNNIHQYSEKLLNIGNLITDLSSMEFDKTESIPILPSRPPKKKPAGLPICDAIEVLK